MNTPAEVKTSATRILTTHVGSIPRPESITRMGLRSRRSKDMLARAHRLKGRARGATRGEELLMDVVEAVRTIFAVRRYQDKTRTGRRRSAGLSRPGA